MDTDSHTELGWLWLAVFCSVYSGRVLEYFREVGASVAILDRWMVKTGFCLRQFRQSNEHQHYLNKKLNSELHGEVEFIQTSLKVLFFIPQQKWNFISDFRLQAFLSAVCEHVVQSFTVARWKDFPPHSEYKGQMSVKYKKKLDNKPLTLSLYSISFWQK